MTSASPPSGLTAVRGAAPLTEAVRAARPELAGETTGTLIRAGLAVLAGYGLPQALRLARPVGGTHPLPRTAGELPEPEAAAPEPEASTAGASAA